MQLEFLVGPQVGLAGAAVKSRATYEGSLVTQDAHGRYMEAAYRGNLYAGTAQTGVTTGAGLGTTGNFVLYNPIGSGKNLALIYAGCTNTVVFAAVAVIWVAVGATPQPTAPSTTTAATVYNMGGYANKPAGQLYSVATIVQPIAVATLGAGLTGAVNLFPQIATIGRFFDGSLIVPPGQLVCLQTSAASGASGFFGEMIWEEFPTYPAAG